jgi:hypothetical protein
MIPQRRFTWNWAAMDRFTISALPVVIVLQPAKLGAWMVIVGISAISLAVAFVWGLSWRRIGEGTIQLLLCFWLYVVRVTRPHGLTLYELTTDFRSALRLTPDSAIMFLSFAVPAAFVVIVGTAMKRSRSPARKVEVTTS